MGPENKRFSCAFFLNLNFGGKKLAGKKLAGKNWREKIGGKSFKAKFKKP